jgi:hypothetical protein
VSLSVSLILILGQEKANRIDTEEAVPAAALPEDNNKPTTKGNISIVDDCDDPCLFVVLENGRKLAYAEYGDPQGKPVFHCHGSGGSRLERPPPSDDESFNAYLRQLGVRWIGMDRPGHG